MDNDTQNDNMINNDATDTENTAVPAEETVEGMDTPAEAPAEAPEETTEGESGDQPDENQGAM